MSDQIFWFATRGAGILAWFAATLSLGVGLMMSSRALGRRPTIPWLLDVHRFFGAMSIVFLAVHLITLWADSFVTLSVVDFIVPGRAEVPGLSRLSMVWGVLAAWILVLVEASSLIKNHLPARFWHTLHLGSFGVVVMGLIHGIQTGSDADNRLLMATAASLLAAVAILTLTRLSRVLGDRKYRYDMELNILDDEPLELIPAVGGGGRRDLPAPPTHRQRPILEPQPERVEPEWEEPEWNEAEWNEPEWS